MNTTVSIERTGRRTWTVWASTVPAGGTYVARWRRFTEKGAERKAAKVLAGLRTSDRWHDERTVGVA